MKKPLEIFLVDDDVDDQEIFMLMVQEIHPDTQCYFANDGVAAIEKLSSDPTFNPDFIFLDMNMPRMNGIECLRKIMADQNRKETNIIIYTTTSDPRLRDNCLALGALHVINKASSLEGLKNQLVQVFKQKLIS